MCETILFIAARALGFTVSRCFEQKQSDRCAVKGRVPIGDTTSTYTSGVRQLQRSERNEQPAAQCLQNVLAFQDVCAKTDQRGEATSR